MSETPINKIVSRIVGAEKLMKVFGYWPSFHDAEVISFKLERSNDEESPLPTITLVLEAWELTSEVNAQGFLVCNKHTHVTMKFTAADEIDLAGFNHQNAIFGLRLELKPDEAQMDEVFIVILEPAFGLGGQFECRGIEVVEAVPFIPKS